MKRLKELIINLDSHSRTGKDIENVEQIIESEYLTEDPNNTELWIRLALLELMIPLVDMYKSLDCLYKVLELDPNNIQAILLIAHVKTTTLGGIDDDLFKKLCDFKTSNRAYQSLIEHAKADYYYTKRNMLMYEKSLVKSIEFYDKFVRNYLYLALIYKNNCEFLKANQLLEKAMKNVKLVYLRDRTYLIDYTDVNEYFNEHLKGIHLSQPNYEFILQYLEEISKSIEKDKLKNRIS